MDKPDMNLDKIASICRLEKRHNAKLYHQTKLLLELYRKVVWSVENSLYDLESTATDFGSQRIQDLLNYLELDFEGDVDKVKIEDHLKSIEKSKDLVFLIDQAMMKLNDYPNGGKLFFSIINYKYILTYLYTDSDLMESLDLERTTFYKRKKEAINMLGTILWGYVIPGLDHPDELLYVADEPAAYHARSSWRTQCELGTNQK